MKALFTSLIIIISLSAAAQKKVLDHPDFDIWNTIQNKTIAPDGNAIMYSLEKGETDNFLKIRMPSGELAFSYNRAQKGEFTYNSEYAIFTITAWQDTIKEMKRRKVKSEDMPKDSLGIYSLKDKSLIKIANIKSHKIPKKWTGFIAYQLEEIKASKEESSDKEEGSSPGLQAGKERNKTNKNSHETRKTGKENGYHLVVRNINTAKQDTFRYVSNYIFAEEGKRLAFVSTGLDSNTLAGVYVLNLENMMLTNLLSAKKSKYPQIAFSKNGKDFAFVADTDTTKTRIRPYGLYSWSEGMEKAEKLLDNNTAPEGYLLSSNKKINFSEDGESIYFGLATPPVLNDTSLLEDEIVNVEVWTYNEPRLYTVQELDLEKDRKKSYTAVIHLDDPGRVIQLATSSFPDVEISDKGNAPYALAVNSEPYQLESQWLGGLYKDYAIVDIHSGKFKQILTKIRGDVSLSPKGKYIYGYNMSDSTYFTYSIATAKLSEFTKGKVFYDELNDSPTPPYPYGSAGWTEDDAAILIYDRYDIWKFYPEKGAMERLTKGRENKTVYRYIKLDNEQDFINDKAKWLLSAFNEESRNSGYYEYNSKNGRLIQLLFGAYHYGRPVKAINNDRLIFSRESFREFPDIRYSDLSFKKQVRISHANPQQEDYNWGTAEIVKWTSLDGRELEGMLIKPENFDPDKKYPMIVNFYEKSSEGLYRHHAPSPGRSTINYSFYASRGYLIFNPDVYYRIGYPGESAFNCVIPGVTALINKGFVDKNNIGVQGHSWGGYQIAYLVTRTDIFKAAEAGAPVPNMISAYGGIRWWTGLSRQFQYEHTQSRIGGTPWEYPSRYIENSPIFNIDKINTPVLIMHNDADGHVPWYQGIEFFMALRRLGKESWFLNYNGEPHWPLKMQNRKDFNIRLAQFFDYYLKGQPMPVWMERGVPAIEKGINQGLELTVQ